eukprot:3709654-Pleurochrysis_carterae.AAC.2
MPIAMTGFADMQCAPRVAVVYATRGSSLGERDECMAFYWLRVPRSRVDARRLVYGLLAACSFSILSSLRLKSRKGTARCLLHAGQCIETALRLS